MSNQKTIDALFTQLYDPSFYGETTLPIGSNHDTLAMWETPIKAESSKECECGVHKTYGKDCPQEYHVDYCPLYKKDK